MIAYIYIYIFIYYIHYTYTYMYIYIIYISYIFIYKLTLPAAFYIQWRISVYTTNIMCQSGHLTFARFEHFVCHRCIWYIFSLVCSVYVIQKIFNSINMFIQAQWWKKYLSRVSLITCSWTNKIIVYIYIYIYMYIYRSKPSKTQS